MGLEVAGVNRLEARLLDRQTQQAPAGRHHRGRGFRPHVTGGQQSEAIGARRFHLLHPGDRRDAFGKALPFGFNLDAEAAAEHLAAELRHRADERDLALIEQRHAIANALHPFEQVRGQQHAHTTLFEVADDLEQLDGGLRVETRRRFVEDRDLRLLHQDFGDAESLAHAA